MAGNLKKTFEMNPAYTQLYLDILAFCDQERSEEEVLAFADEHRSSCAQIQSSSSLIDTLVRHGGLKKTVLVDGEPYQGSFEDFQTDEEIPEEAEIAIVLQSTDVGRQAAQAEEEALSFDVLVQPFPQRADAFRYTLESCKDGGLSTRELQSLLKEHGMLETEEARGIDGLHASYFTGALERIGALAWNGKKWVTSDKGLAILNRP